MRQHQIRPHHNTPAVVDLSAPHIDPQKACPQPGSEQTYSNLGQDLKLGHVSRRRAPTTRNRPERGLNAASRASDVRG